MYILLVKISNNSFDLGVPFFIIMNYYIYIVNNQYYDELFYIYC